MMGSHNMYTYLDNQGLRREEQLLLPQWKQDPFSPDARVIAYHRTRQGQLVVLSSLITGAAISVGFPPPTHYLPLYQNSWYFTNLVQAYISYREMQNSSLSEPRTWEHHPATGRYRIHGKADWEYTQSIQGTIEQEVVHAVRIQLLEGYALYAISEQTEMVGSTFRRGTRLFCVEVMNHVCPHSPRCRWPTFVFWYQGRCVALDTLQLLTTSIGMIRFRLGQDLHQHTGREDRLPQIAEVRGHSLEGPNIPARMRRGVHPR